MPNKDENNLTISYLNGYGDTIYPFSDEEIAKNKKKKRNIEQTHDELNTYEALVKNNRRHTDKNKAVNMFNRLGPSNNNFNTPEKQTITDTEIKRLWVSVYSATVAYSRSTLAAKEQADLAILDYKERFPHG